MEEKMINERKTVVDGKLHKCPNCGEQLNAFTTICPVCSYELRGTQATSCVHELSMKLETCETDAKKAQLISNFYIPNTKEDIYEFFILAYSNIAVGGSEIDAWRIKLEQAYLKAKVAFGDSEEYHQIKELYDQLPKKVKKKRRIDFGLIASIVLFTVGLVIAIVCLIKDGRNDLDDRYSFYGDSEMHSNLQLIAKTGLVCSGVGVLLLVWQIAWTKFKNKKPHKR